MQEGSSGGTTDLVTIMSVFPRLKPSGYNMSRAYGTVSMKEVSSRRTTDFVTMEFIPLLYVDVENE